MSAREPAGGGAERGTARIDRALERIRGEGRVGLMTHIVLGYPTLEASRQILGAMVRSGVDLIEVQIPFSDPTADGPTITGACHKALEGGVRVADGFRLLREAAGHGVPLLFMSYFNILFGYGAGAPGQAGRSGVAAFVEDAAAAGAAGLIVPDIPPEESSDGYIDACRANAVHPIHVISPNIPDRRLEAVARVAGGFIYSTSRTGTTGKDVEIEFAALAAFLDRAHRICRLPIAVGFGINRREQVEALRGRAEIAVVGSHLIRVYEKHGLAALERELRKLAGRKD